jgi:hypothetical protein
MPSDGLQFAFNAAEIGVDTDKTGITQTKRQTVNPAQLSLGTKTKTGVCCGIFLKYG